MFGKFYNSTEILADIPETIILAKIRGEVSVSF